MHFDFQKPILIMKTTQIIVRLFIGLLIYSCLSGCQDLEKLFAKPGKSAETVIVKQVPAPTNALKKLSLDLPSPCHFAPEKLPKNIEVYAIDGQAWIEATEKSGVSPEGIATITVNIDAPEVSALLLTAKQRALWQIKATQRTKLWGVYVTADKTQSIAGVNKDTLLQQHYAELSDECGFYWRPELQVHELYDFSRLLFGKPYIALPKIINGVVNVKSIETATKEITPYNEAVITGHSYSALTSPEKILPPVNQAAAKAQAAHKSMTLNEALRANLIRPGSSADIERFKSRYLGVNRKPVGSNFDDYIRIGSVYVITADFTYPEGLYGAHSVVFIIENRAPYPQGNPGHSQVLDMNSGTCMGITCRSLMQD